MSLRPRAFIAEVAELAGADPTPALGDTSSRMPWWSRSVDSTYLTSKRVFIFGDATHAVAAARIAREELGFEVCGLGCYNREFAREIRAEAARCGVEPLITDDHLAVEDAIAAACPELVLGTLRNTTRAFLDAVAASPAGRFAIVSQNGVANPTASNANYLAAKAAAETWLLAVGNALKDTPAQVHIERVMALYSDRDVEQAPDKDFSRHTHVDELGRRLAALFDAE